MIQEEIKSLNDTVGAECEKINRLKAEMHKVIVGQDYLIDRLIIGLLSNGHVLLEGIGGRVWWAAP